MVQLSWNMLALSYVYYDDLTVVALAWFSFCISYIGLKLGEFL